MKESNQTPNWQPISFLPQIAEMIDGMLASAQEGPPVANGQKLAVGNHTKIPGQ